MRRLLSFLSEIIPIVVAGVLLIHLLLPEIEKSIALPAGSQPSEGKAEEQGTGPAAAEVPLNSVARLFGWKPKPLPVKTEPPKVVKKEIVVQPTPPPPVVDWLTHMGSFVDDEDNKKSFFFKNNKTQSVFTITVGEMKQNWKLLEAGEEVFLFQFEGKEYKIQVQ